MAKKKSRQGDIPEDQEAALELALMALQKDFGAGCVITGDRSRILGVEYIPSGSLGLDRILGGGYAKGRIIEVSGLESAGKTTLALHAVAECQKAEGKAAFIDMEQSFDAEYAENIGVDIEKLLFSQPNSGEEALQILDTLTRTGAISLIVLDSVAALVPSAELEGSMLDNQMGLQARLMSKACRKLVSLLNKTNTCVIFLNQIRMKIGGYGSPDTVSGGNALKFYSSQRLDIRRIATLERGEEKVGIKTKIKITKNKVASPFKQTEVNIMFGRGLDLANEVSTKAIEKGPIKKTGTWFALGEKSFQGQFSLDDYLRLNREALQDLMEKIV